MDVLGVDLAAECSAAVRLTSDFLVAAQFDSLQMSNEDFVRTVAMHGFECSYGDPALLRVEDTPPGLRFDINTKKVCRLQGRLLEAIEHLSLIGSIGGLSKPTVAIDWVGPLTWMRHFGYINKAKSGSTASFAKATCAEFGYIPPPTIKGGSSKLLQDYRAAYLISRHAHETSAATRVLR